MTWIIVIVGLIILLKFLLFLMGRKDSANDIIREVSKYGDNQLTPGEMEISALIFNMLQAIKSEPNLMNIRSANYDRAIEEIALEVFKSGMYRLKSKEMANHFFKNRGYVNANKEKFITDINSKIDNYYFDNFSRKQVNEYLLYWILKFRDDSKAINSFLA